VSVVSLVEHLARRIHLLKLHRGVYERCPDWECQQNREWVAHLDARERVV
jgi:hypothetical protein